MFSDLENLSYQVIEMPPSEPQSFEFSATQAATGLTYVWSLCWAGGLGTPRQWRGPGLGLSKDAGGGDAEAGTGADGKQRKVQMGLLFFRGQLINIFRTSDNAGWISGG